MGGDPVLNDPYFFWSDLYRNTLHRKGTSLRSQNCNTLCQGPSLDPAVAKKEEITVNHG
jgi:hypothetical protein